MGLECSALCVCASLQVPVSEEPEQYSSSPQLDQHQVYSLNDFQPFESDTYNGESLCSVAVPLCSGGGNSPCSRVVFVNFHPTKEANSSSVVVPSIVIFQGCVHLDIVSSHMSSWILYILLLDAGKRGRVLKPVHAQTYSTP